MLLASGVLLAWALWYNRNELHPRRGFVLQYHSVVDDWGAAVATSPYERLFSVGREVFDAQMRALAGQGYRFISNGEMVDALEGREGLPARWVVVTFDDGWRSVYDNAFPVMRELGIPATIFLTTDPQSEVFTSKAAVDRPLTEAQVREMAAVGIDFQGHGVTHGDLSRMAEAEVRRELTESRAAIEALTGRTVDSYSLPGTTRHTHDLVRVSKELGYQSIHTPFIGAVAPGADPMMVRRILVEGTFGVEELFANLRPVPILVRKVISYLKKLPPRILGPRIWIPIRAFLFNSPLAPIFTTRGLTFLLGTAVLLGGAMAWLVSR